MEKKEQEEQEAFIRVVKEMGWYVLRTRTGFPFQLFTVELKKILFVKLFFFSTNRGLGNAARLASGTWKRRKGVTTSSKTNLSPTVLEHAGGTADLYSCICGCHFCYRCGRVPYGNHGECAM